MANRAKISDKADRRRSVRIGMEWVKHLHITTKRCAARTHRDTGRTCEMWRNQFSIFFCCSLQIVMETMELFIDVSWQKFHSLCHLQSNLKNRVPWMLLFLLGKEKTYNSCCYAIQIFNFMLLFFSFLGFHYTHILLANRILLSHCIMRKNKPRNSLVQNRAEEGK
jgi:hypothetical protein